MVLNSLFISGRCKYIKLFPRINKKGKISLAPPELSIKTNGYTLMGKICYLLNF